MRTVWCYTLTRSSSSSCGSHKTVIPFLAQCLTRRTEHATHLPHVPNTQKTILKSERPRVPWNTFRETPRKWTKQTCLWAPANGKATTNCRRCASPTFTAESESFSSRHASLLDPVSVSSVLKRPHQKWMTRDTCLSSSQSWRCTLMFGSGSFFRKCPRGAHGGEGRGRGQRLTLGVRVQGWHKEVGLGWRMGSLSDRNLFLRWAPWYFVLGSGFRVWRVSRSSTSRAGVRGHSFAGR